MIDHRAIGRYARALFELSEKRRELETVDRQFIEIARLVRQRSEIPHLLLNSTITLAEKEDFIDKIVPPGTPAILINFLKVLVKKKRFNELVMIQDQFHRLCEKKLGIREVEAVAAIPLSPALEDKLREVLKKKLRSEIRLAAKVDRKMIGGLILRFDGREVNSSLRYRLEELKQVLI